MGYCSPKMRSYVSEDYERPINSFNSTPSTYRTGLNDFKNLINDCLSVSEDIDTTSKELESLKEKKKVLVKKIKEHPQYLAVADIFGNK